VAPHNVILLIYANYFTCRTLEELQYTFELPTRLHIRYRMRYITTWLGMRFALPTAKTLHLPIKKPKTNPKAYTRRMFFDLWGPEQVRKVTARKVAASGTTPTTTSPPPAPGTPAAPPPAFKKKELFYPWGKAKAPKKAKPASPATKPTDSSGAPAADSTPEAKPEK